MAECNATHPDTPSVRCVLDHLYGDHYDPGTDQYWPGPTPPLKAGRKGSTQRIREVAEHVGQHPAPRVGPPPDPELVYRQRDHPRRQVAPVLAAVVDATTPEYREAFLAEARRWAHSGRSFTSEDITGTVGIPSSSGKVGALMAAFLREGIVHEVGSVSSRRNGSRIGIYQKIKSQEEPEWD